MQGTLFFPLALDVFFLILRSFRPTVHTTSDLRPFYPPDFDVVVYMFQNILNEIPRATMEGHFSERRCP